MQTLPSIIFLLVVSTQQPNFIAEYSHDKHTVVFVSRHAAGPIYLSRHDKGTDCRKEKGGVGFIILPGQGLKTEAKSDGILCGALKDGDVSVHVATYVCEKKDRHCEEIIGNF